MRASFLKRHGVILEPVASRPAVVGKLPVWLLWSLLLLVLPGCEGCRPTPGIDDVEKRREEIERKKREMEAQKPPVEQTAVTVLPGSIPTGGMQEEDSETNTRIGLKPGHWVQVQFQIKANDSDYSGDLATSCVAGWNNPAPLTRMPFQLTCTRPVSLPKDQTKFVEAPFFTPVPDNRRTTKAVQIRSELKGAGRTRSHILNRGMPTIRLNPHQHYLLVVSPAPDRYGFLKAARSVSPPIDDWNIEGLPQDYIVLMIAADENLPLPSNALAWTSIAYVVWDQLDASLLTEAQQQALVDWIHWGGQLILNGRSMETLKESFLAEYLPAAAGDTLIASTDRIKLLNDRWTVYPPRVKDTDKAKYRFAEDPPLELLELMPAAGASWVDGTGEMVVERNVGRGRIVATAFSLTERRVINWRSFDSFLNGCLLRRPVRQFKRGDDGFPMVRWNDYPERVRDPLLTSQLRYFSRDAKSPIVTGRRGRNVAGQDDLTVRAPSWSARFRSKEEGYAADPSSGVAGWTDFGAAANAARASLQRAAGISVPDNVFVAKILAAYLLILVPANWLLFRLVNRVEWAWFAAPLIAIAGTVAVVRLAQLDIGFVRSRSEIAIAELQGQYDRAHVTRFAALYTSLSTRYSLQFANVDAFALPFSTDLPDEQLRQVSRQEVEFRRDQASGLRRYPVLSNSTGMVHTEQMVTLAGPIQFTDGGDAWRIRNDCGFALQTALLVHRRGTRARIYALGDLPTGAEAVVDRAADLSDREVDEQLAASFETSERSPAGEISLRGLYRLGLDARQLDEDGLRLVAWTDEPVEGMIVKPRSSQERFRTLLVANLRRGNQPRAKPDVNLVEEVTSEEDDDW